MATIIYSFQKGFPLTTYGETIVIEVQLVVRSAISCSHHISL